MTSWQIYWLTRLDPLGEALVMVCVVSGLLSIGSIIERVNRSDHDLKSDPKTYQSLDKIWGIVRLVFIISNIGWFIPSTKEMAAILILPKIINNQKVQEMPNKVLDLANEWLDELRPVKK